MNNYCRALTFSPELYPNIDVSKYDTEGYNWVQFHKTLQPDELNSKPLFEYLKSLNMCSEWIELFYTPPNEDGIIHSDNTNWEDWTKIYFQFGALGSKLRWWESDKTMEVSTSTSEYIEDYRDRTEEHYHGQVLVAMEEDSTMVHEEDLRSPHLVNVGKLHCSHNPTNEKRFALTIALFDLKGNRILWDDAISRLSKNIL